MSTAKSNAELPKNLLAIIADAQNAVSNWGSDDDSNLDPELRTLMDGTREWAERLSRGEFDENLYWECVAEDCKEASDWNGAKAAYRKIIHRPASHVYDVGNAHSEIGFLQRMLGEYEEALASYHTAAELHRSDAGILARLYYNCEARLFLSLGRIEQARATIRLAESTFEEGYSDFLVWSRLLITSAGCDLAEGKLSAAQQLLTDAWESLEVLRTQLGVDGMKDAIGVYASYRDWWHAESMRRRLADNGKGEIEALCRARDEAGYSASPSGWHRFDHDLALMRSLLALAAAYDRHHQPDVAAATRAEAEEIRSRRRFPSRDEPEPIPNPTSELDKPLHNV